MRQKTHHPVVAGIVKESFDVSFHYPLGVVIRDDLA